MGDISSEIITLVNSNTDYILAEQERKLEEHMFEHDPHFIKPYIDQQMLDIRRDLSLEIENLVNNLESEILKVISARLSYISSEPTAQDIVSVLRY